MTFVTIKEMAKAKSNYVRNGVQFVRHVVPRVVKPLHSLWNELIGFLFLSLAFVGAVRGIRMYRSEDSSTGRLVVVGVFVAVMAFYGVSSFLRARKISRS